jgi:hypothetical protein
MADNVTLPGTGTVVAADDVSSVWYQQMKLVSGTLGETAAIPGDATNGLDVDVTRVIPGTDATHLGKAEDAAHTSGDVGVMALGVRKDVPVALSPDGDYHPFELGPTGRMWVSSGGGESVTLTLTVDNNAYTIGDVVGGLLTFAAATRLNGGHSIINSVKLCGVTAIPYELYFFNADLATANQLDDAVLTVAAADGLKFLGVVSIAAADYVLPTTAFNNACVKGCGLQVKSTAATTSVYGYLKALQTTTPGTTTIYLTVDFEYVD